MNMRTLIVLLLLSTLAHSQDSLGIRCDESTAEPFRNYSDGYAISTAEHRPLLVFVSGKTCPPCKALKRDVLEPMRLARQLGDCVLVEVDGESAQGMAVTKIRVVPQVFAFANGVRYSISLPVTRDKLVSLIDTIRTKARTE